MDANWPKHRNNLPLGRDVCKPFPLKKQLHGELDYIYDYNSLGAQIPLSRGTEQTLRSYFSSLSKEKSLGQTGDHTEGLRHPPEEQISLRDQLHVCTSDIHSKPRATSSKR